MGSRLHTSGDGGRVRKTAEERREEILDAAVTEFAAHGLRGASVEDMAEKVGVSQSLCLPAVRNQEGSFSRRCRTRSWTVLDTFQEGASAGHNNLETLGQSYSLEFFRREEMMLLLQGFAASEDPEVKEAMVSGFVEIWRFVQEATRASDKEVWNFMSDGMMLTVDAAIGLMPRLGKEEWLQKYMRDEL